MTSIQFRSNDTSLAPRHSLLMNRLHLEEGNQKLLSPMSNEAETEKKMLLCSYCNGKSQSKPIPFTRHIFYLRRHNVFLEYPSSDRGHLSLCYLQAKYTKHFDAASRSVAGACGAMTKSFAPLGKERFQEILFMTLRAKFYP